MFKSIIPLVCGLIACFATVGLADENDLFSGVRSGSVFGDVSAQSTATPITRVTSIQDLNQMLTEAGLESKVAGTRVILTKKELDDWAFNVLVTISEDEMTIGLTMPLSTLKDESKLSSTQLLKLLEANQKHAPSVFTFSAERKRTELYHILPNESITGQKLRDEINRLAVLAKGTVDLWKMPGAEAKPTDTKPTETSSPASPSPESTSTASLIGAWSASKSKTEAIAIRFESGDKFQLVYVKAGKQSKSSGKFSINGDKLQLVGDDGIRLEGKLVIASATKFTFTPSAAIGPLQFNKAAAAKTAK
ncbi:hypothetical protein LOC68_02640 [Blastopirellula sp. JC732]|uniref:Uncharacterized protein n=1 Tax=Blastopirellula sediminis TaxID=2894196 RepID=A0A9X1SF73_9BACT|nr:hypothetical protein [Blastopirellula sediminis]MCC9607926.1 hypothetical protein [Blastopirellula sediminis]MCC9627281.1 hypothetical protein [Blastopirellula sediminis]